jgi:hypothetical protein
MIMKRLSLFIALTMLVAGCAQNLELAEPAAIGNVDEVQTQPQTRSVQGAVYNEVVDAWMIPQPDPYTLANFQAAYDKLASGRSAQKLSKAQTAGFVAAKKLKPTHYALKIYPKSEDEQWRVEMMADVRVAYIPFSFAQLTGEEVSRIEKSKTRSAANTFPEKSPYTVTYNYTEVTDGGPTGPVTYQLPILYTVWPVTKPLPTDLEYVVDYEVFLPPKSNDKTRSGSSPTPLSDEAMRSLVGEALSMALGVSGDPTIPLKPSSLTAYVRTSDNILNSMAPLANLKVRLQLGAHIHDTATMSNGWFVIPWEMDDQDITYGTLSFIYQDHSSSRWKITTNTSNLTPYTNSMGHIHTLWNTLVYPMDTEIDIALQSGPHQENEIHRAVSCFFDNQSVFNRSVSVTGPMTIIANDFAYGNIGGSFSLGDAAINIYNYGGTNGNVIGTTLHEIGHFAHFNNGSAQYRNTPKFLRESFASYAGWYLGLEYYKTQGWIHPDGNPQIVGSSQQDWQKTDTGNLSWYSPLFIDLTDNYNQAAALGSYFPNDNIQGVSASNVWNMITTSTSWTQIKPKIVAYVGSSGWIDNFQYWFDNNPIVY